MTALKIKAGDMLFDARLEDRIADRHHLRRAGRERHDKKKEREDARHPTRLAHRRMPGESEGGGNGAASPADQNSRFT